MRTGQPNWDASKSDLSNQIEGLDSFVVIGKDRQGQGFVASTTSREQTQKLLQENAGDLIAPQHQT